MKHKYIIQMDNNEGCDLVLSCHKRQRRCEGDLVDRPADCPLVPAAPLYANLTFFKNQVTKALQILKDTK